MSGAMTERRRRYLEEMGLAPIWQLRSRVAGRAAQADDMAELAVEAAVADDMSAGPRPANQLPQISSPAANAGRQPAAMAGRDIARPSADLVQEWRTLREEVADCQACSLCRQRKQAVLGVGDLQPDLLVIGEGPGAEEDQRGEPFVGQAGKLLDAMLASIGLARGRKVYIANAVKCRPPGNRTPEPNEMAACRPYLERQIALLKPKLILLLGRAAAHSVLNDDRALAALRGKTFAYGDIPVLVSYHPAYLLRNLTDKAKSWEDLCRVRAGLLKRGD